MYNSFSSSDDSSEDSISSPLLLGHSSMDSSSDEFEGHYDYPLPYFSESDSSSDDEDFHSHDDDEGPQILDDNNLSRVHISPLNDTDQCIHYDLPHKEAKSLFFPAETNNYLINVLKTELKPILQRAHKEVHELELNTRKFVQTQSQACRSAVADPEFLASSHLFYFIEEATNRFFTDAAKKLDNLCKENEMQQKLHFERWMSKVNYFFSRTKEDFMKSNKVERLMRSQVVPKAVFQDVQHCLICTDKKPEVAFQYNADDLENMVPCTCTNVNMCLECALSTYWASTRETGMSFAKCPFCKGHFKVENVIKVKPVLPPQPVIINNTNNTNNSNNNGPEKVLEAKTEKEAPEGRRYPKRQRKK